MEEDLSDNLFLKTLRARHKELFDHAAQNLFVICAPSNKSLAPNPARDIFESHILQPSPFFKGQYETLNGKSVSIEGDQIETGKGFASKKKSRILFEEVFYNSEYKPHQVICIDRPFEGECAPSKEQPQIDIFREHTTTAEQLAFLRQHANMGEGLVCPITPQVYRFNQSYVLVKGFVDDTARKIERIVLDGVQWAASDFPALRSCSTNKNHRVVLVRAVQTHVLKSVHERLYGGLRQMYIEEDRRISDAIIASQPSTSLSHLGVDRKIPESIDLTAAIRIVTGVAVDDVPMPRIQALKQTMASIQQSVVEAVAGEVALATDDLLPLLIFVLIKANPPNLFSSTEYLKHFCSIEQSSDEWGFFVANLSAAVEYIFDQQSSRLPHATSTNRMCLPQASSAPKPTPRPIGSTSLAPPPASTLPVAASDGEAASRFGRHARGLHVHHTAAVGGGFFNSQSPDVPKPETLRPSPEAISVESAGTSHVTVSSTAMFRNFDDDKSESDDEANDLGDFLSNLKASDEVVSGSSRRW